MEIRVDTVLRNEKFPRIIAGGDYSREATIKILHTGSRALNSLFYYSNKSKNYHIIINELNMGFLSVANLVP